MPYTVTIGGAVDTSESDVINTSQPRRGNIDLLEPLQPLPLRTATTTSKAYGGNTEPYSQRQSVGIRPNNGGISNTPVLPPASGMVPLRQKQTFVLCFDGTLNKFSGTESDSNILKLYRMLDRTDPNMYTFYQPGIGTYISSHAMEDKSRYAKARAFYMKAKDSAFGSNFANHVMGGYQFLMRYYSCEDDLYFFGFSRGAYTARFLAEMLDHIGLLAAGNEELIHFAWRTYAKWASRRTDGSKAAKEKVRKLYTFMKGFRETFSRPVRRVRFLGLFDTVNSVPRFESAWMQRSKFPYTAKSSAKVIRHAVSIDERRAKFRSDLLGNDAARTGKPVKQGNLRLPHGDHATMEHPADKADTVKIACVEVTEGTDGEKEPFAAQGFLDLSPITPIVKINDQVTPLTENGFEAIEAVGSFGPTATDFADPSTIPISICSFNENLPSNLPPAKRKTYTISSQQSLEVPDPAMLNLDDIAPERRKSFESISSAISNVTMTTVDSVINHKDAFDEDARMDENGQFPRRDFEPHKRQDIQEVWFSGGHGDVGGGWTRQAGEKVMLAHAPLVWMATEAMKAGLHFDMVKVSSQKCTPNKADDFGREQICEDTARKFYARLEQSYTTGHAHDCLTKGAGRSNMAVRAWQMMEYLPFRRIDLQPDGTWKAISWPLPMGETRDIPDDAQIHHTVIKRMQAMLDYRPGNLIVGGGGRGVRTAPREYGIGEWEVYQNAGDRITETWRRKPRITAQHSRPHTQSRPASWMSYRDMVRQKEMI